MRNQKIAQDLGGYQLTLTNATDPEILEATQNFNYDTERIAEGTVLLQQAQQLNIKQEKEYGEQYSATTVLDNAIDEFNDSTYMPHIRLARKLFATDNGILSMLDVNGRRRWRYEEYISQARTFYNNALSTPQVLSKFAMVNITTETLQASLDQLNNLDLLRAAQKNESGEAQQATDDRDRAMDEINEWMSLYYTVAKIALADKPQLLEKLGVKA
ncbi:hypothetical protein [Sunxiuqinia dokdonensis]|uniref:Uncharacterized protein n=1 Tax=Sunxiuqinia dokdonensis TaxID=1409788 RepID=A0A0L8V612_9BACT|nr:hypothetical protein [Sunxiuqinia dokdonensis]KOH43876.1 hypothetical protein NC99_33720 [Sunxiuqinia dokdonensis]